MNGGFVAGVWDTLEKAQAKNAQAERRHAAMLESQNPSVRQFALLNPGAIVPDDSEAASIALAKRLRADDEQAEKARHEQEAADRAFAGSLASSAVAREPDKRPAPEGQPRPPKRARSDHRPPAPDAAVALAERVRRLPVRENSAAAVLRAVSKTRGFHVFIDTKENLNPQTLANAIARKRSGAVDPCTVHRATTPLATGDYWVVYNAPDFRGNGYIAVVVAIIERKGSVDIQEGLIPKRNTGEGMHGTVTEQRIRLATLGADKPPVTAVYVVDNGGGAPEVAGFLSDTKAGFGFEDWQEPLPPRSGLFVRQGDDVADTIAKLARTVPGTSWAAYPTVAYVQSTYAPWNFWSEHTSDVVTLAGPLSRVDGMSIAATTQLLHICTLALGRRPRSLLDVCTALDAPTDETTLGEFLTDLNEWDTQERDHGGWGVIPALAQRRAGARPRKTGTNKHIPCLLAVLRLSDHENQLGNLIRNVSRVGGDLSHSIARDLIAAQGRTQETLLARPQNELDAVLGIGPRKREVRKRRVKALLIGVAEEPAAEPAEEPEAAAKRESQEAKRSLTRVVQGRRALGLETTTLERIIAWG